LCDAITGALGFAGRREWAPAPWPGGTAMIMLTQNVTNRNMALTLVAWLVIPVVIMGTSLGDGLIEEATRGGA
jgi:hypothetical protein